MLLVRAIVNANKNWVTRAGARWNAAALEIDQGKYEPNELFRDIFRSVVADPFDWYLDFTRESETTRIIIEVTGTATSGSSDLIPVRRPANTTVTSLSRLGGTEQMVQGTHVDVRQPNGTTIPDGTIEIALTGLTSAAHPKGEYLGFLIEDKLPLAYVIARR